MDSKEIHTRIDLILEKFARNNKSLGSREDNFSELETDALKQHCIELYDLVAELKYKNTTVFKKTKVNESRPVIEEEVIEETADQIEEKKIDVETTEEVINNIKEPIIEVVPNQFDMPKFVPIKEAPVQSYTTPTKPMEKENSVLDSLGETAQKETLHDSMSDKRNDQQPDDKFLGVKISKITDAIDISKRFELQTNLFATNTQSYIAAIQSLEEAVSKFSALEVFNRLAEKHKWDLENELVLELKSFIYRKF